MACPQALATPISRVNVNLLRYCQVSRFLTNPNALCVTAGMEYIPACVSTWLSHDMVLVYYYAEECRAASARICGTF